MKLQENQQICKVEILRNEGRYERKFENRRNLAVFVRQLIV